MTIFETVGSLNYKGPLTRELYEADLKNRKRSFSLEELTKRNHKPRSGIVDGLYLRLSKYYFINK
jgi:hypothetical protein